MVIGLRGMAYIARFRQGHRRHRHDHRMHTIVAHTVGTWRCLVEAGVGADLELELLELELELLLEAELEPQILAHEFQIVFACFSMQPIYLQQSHLPLSMHLNVP